MASRLRSRTPKVADDSQDAGGSDMRILVTGSTGYIGAVLTRALRANGHDVVGLDCDLFEPCTFGEWTDQPALLRKDVRDIEASDLAGCDAVVHLSLIHI